MVRSKHCIAFVALIFMFGAVTMAQAQANDDVDVTATVTSSLAISTSADAAFGTLLATTGGAVVLDPQGTAHANCGAGAAAGRLDISGGNSLSVHLGVPPTIALSNGATGTMTLTVAVSGDGSSANQATSTDLSPSGGYVDVTTSASGGYYVWVGGSLGTLTAQETGSYTGTGNFTVEYN